MPSMMSILYFVLQRYIASGWCHSNVHSYINRHHCCHYNYICNHSQTL